MAAVPPFQLGGSRFDSDTFLGRLKGWYFIVGILSTGVLAYRLMFELRFGLGAGIVVQFDPLKLFASSAEIQTAKKLLEVGKLIECTDCTTRAHVSDSLKIFRTMRPSVQVNMGWPMKTFGKPRCCFCYRYQCF